VADRRCFVISPIGEEGTPIRKHADQVLSFIVAPAMRELGIEPIRSDHMPEPGQISQQMLREIITDDLCVAVLTYQNPNVFYELAVAQCASRPIVLMLEKGQRTPFDIQDLRILDYDFDLFAIDRGDYKDALVAQVRQVLMPTWEPVNPLAMTSAQWTPDQQRRIEKLIETSRPRPLPPGTAATFALPDDPTRQIVVRTGDIDYVRNVDVIVNSENTDLQLARCFDASMSGVLRYLDAEKDGGLNVKVDALNDTLKSEIERLQIQPPVQPGTVIATPTHGLKERGVKYLFHVAAVRGEVGQGYVPVVERIPACIMNSYERFRDLAAAGEPIETMLMPVLGAGSGRLDPNEAIDQMLPHIVSSMQATRACRETHLLARIESHRRAILERAPSHGLRTVC